MLPGSFFVRGRTAAPGRYLRVRRRPRPAHRTPHSPHPRAGRMLDLASFADALVRSWPRRALPGRASVRPWIRATRSARHRVDARARAQSLEERLRPRLSCWCAAPCLDCGRLPVRVTLPIARALDRQAEGLQAEARRARAPQWTALRPMRSMGGTQPACSRSNPAARDKPASQPVRSRPKRPAAPRRQAAGTSAVQRRPDAPRVLPRRRASHRPRVPPRQARWHARSRQGARPTTRRRRDGAERSLRHARNSWRMVHKARTAFRAAHAPRNLFIA